MQTGFTNENPISYYDAVSAQRVPGGSVKRGAGSAQNLARMWWNPSSVFSTHFVTVWLGSFYRLTPHF